MRDPGMMAKTGFIVMALCGMSTVARAADAPTAGDLNTPALPTFALTAPPTDPSPWTGLSIGTEVFGISGGKGLRGGFGGAATAGYERELDNNVVVGIDGSAGYTPSLFKNSPFRGYNFASTDVRVGYDMGRFMPFVTAGVGLARPNGRTFGGFTGAADSTTDLFNATGDLRSFQTVGAGFAYKLTEHTTVELAVQAYHSNGFVVP